MRVSVLAAALAATPALGYPGMKNTMAELQARQGKTAGGKSTEIIGDLATLDSSKLTPVGKTIKDILSGNGNAQSDDAYAAANKKRAVSVHARDYGYGGGGGGGAPGGGKSNSPAPGGGVYGGGGPPGGGAPPAPGGGKSTSPGGGAPPAPGGGKSTSPSGGAPPAPGGGSPPYGGGSPPSAAGSKPPGPGGPPAPGAGGPVPPPPSGGQAPAPGSRSGACPPKDTPACAQDACCIWKYIADDLVSSFRGDSGRCTDAARAAIRLGFHDAAGWSKGTGNLGGADGSIVLAPEEIQRVANKGLEEIVEQTKTWFDKYKGYGIGMADLIQLSANVATITCPLGPRVRTFVGRKDSSVPAPDGLLPDVNSPADVLIDLFNNKTIGPYGLISLIGAHTTSQQRFVDPERAGDPQDSTPGVWDVKFYSETIGNAPPRVFKFNSDIALANYHTTKGTFAAFAGPGGQGAWNDAYAHEYVRLSLLGVYNLNDLKECTKSLPARWAPTTFTPSDQGNVDTWVGSKGPVPKIGDEIREGKPIGPPPPPGKSTGGSGGVTKSDTGSYGGGSPPAGGSPPSGGKSTSPSGGAPPASGGGSYGGGDKSPSGGAPPAPGGGKPPGGGDKSPSGGAPPAPGGGGYGGGSPISGGKSTSPSGGAPPASGGGSYGGGDKSPSPGGGKPPGGGGYGGGAPPAGGGGKPPGGGGAPPAGGGGKAPGGGGGGKAPGGGGGGGGGYY
ncbi:ligninase h2 precursor [Colletotrichum sojae]|uniref:Peroxidase n=1 Tax=Colletotrichum sojae TaxID=2175907 RepID=A0A8H6N0B1_9PEZI|nr:ligninase h2 precursor [Colletotrichum sojae]